MTPGDTENPLLLGLDLGTSAIKGVLTNVDGEVLAQAAANTHLLYPSDGRVEVAPEAHYRAVCGVMRELAAAAPGEVAALAMIGASGNTLLTDEQGRPITSIISWMDRRSASCAPAAISDMRADEVARITGWPCLDSFPLAHLAWLREEDPVHFDAAAHYGMDTDWLLYRLTGLWRMDYSTGTTFHLIDQVKGAYHAPWLKRLGIAQAKLSSLTRPGAAIGPLCAQGARDTGLSARTLAVAGSFDHPAAALAAGVTRPGQLLLSCGTSWVGLLPHAERDIILNAGLLCDPFLSTRGGPWAGMFSVPRIGQTIDWYIAHVIAHDEHDPLGVFNELAALAEPGAEGLEIDLREAPRRVRASRANISRAMMEGAACLLREQILDLRAHGLRFDRAVMVGGPSRSPIWPDIVADITGLDITIGGRSAGARGAAMLAGIGVGLCPGPSFGAAAADNDGVPGSRAS
jgi:xylulokinase